jgi:hypothetical protein
MRRECWIARPDPITALRFLSHCLKDKLCAEVHGGRDRCARRQGMECLARSVERPCVVNNGS